jgi:Family of unknown function (DUF6263)
MLRPFGRLFWLYLLAAVALTTASAQAQTTLRYKFKEGDTLTYVMEQKQDMSMSIMGNDITVKTKQVIDLTWKVGAVDKDGSAKITQTINRVRMSMESLGNKTEFDTKDGKEPTDEAGKTVAAILTAMAGADFTMTMSSRGETSDVKVPQKVLDAVAKAGPAGGAMSGDNFKQIASQGGMVLPKDAVKKGDSWNYKNEVKMDPLGKMIVDNKATYDGEAAKDGLKLDQIIIKPTMTLEATPNSPTKVTLKKQDTKGSASFDSGKGQMVESSMDQNLDMEMEAGGQSVTMKMKQTVGMKLVPAK